MQQERANVAKEIKKQGEALNNMVDDSDEEQRTFEVDKKYSYTNSKGDIIEITIKEIEDGKVTSAEWINDDGKVVIIDPHTENIGDETKKFEKGKTYLYTNADNKEIEVTIKEIDNDGEVKLVEYTNSKNELDTMNPYTDKIGKEVKVQKEEIEADAKT